MKLLATILLVMTVVPALATQQQELTFDVLLDGKEVGYHRFQVERLDNSRVVRSEAEFRVKVLFVTAFRYEHRNVEVWENDCLRSLDAKTDSNGKQLAVKGTRMQDDFLLQAQDSTVTIEPCVATFAYWDRDLLMRERLLNPQTGEYLAVEVDESGPSVIEVGGIELPVQRLRISANGMDITVAYDRRTGDWVALDSLLKNGRTLSYRRNTGELQQQLRLSVQK